MDSDMEDSVFEDFENDSGGYEPEPKPKAKAAAKKPAAKPAVKAVPKKTVQTTLKMPKTASKKRSKTESDDEDDDASGFSNTPPSAKKQKKASTSKKSGGEPLGEIENDSMMVDAPKPGKKTATETYQKLTQLEHILKRPDTYIGSVERTEQQMWVFNKETTQMELRPKVGFVPGLYKIFDEILVNAADNKQRDSSMTYMKVTIDREEGKITVENNGRGIPVEIHGTEGVYIPEMVFGHLLAGSNFDDNEKKTVGGRNGYGAKLCNVFSTEFTLECQDSKNGKRYKQTWTDNMGKMGKAKITNSKSSDFVRVSFRPDFKKFGMENGIDDDLESLLYRRVYDMAGTVRNIKVYLNDTHIKLNFKTYCEMYAKAIARERGAEEGAEPSATVIIDESKAHPEWDIGFAVSDGSFQQVSFVNSIATTTGGTHVNYISDQICESLLKALNKKKKGHSLKSNHIRNHIFIFINCLITNPAFTSQTKEQMTTKVSQFGSKCALTELFLKKIGQTDAISNIIQFAEAKADKMMAKSDGSKRSRISNSKLVDANLAGTKHGHECTLILTEGDSAKSLAVAGRAILDPDRIGVFPLRGKMLNVRDASIDQITKNQEIQNIKQFLGLKHKQVYTDTKSLRYGHLMIMADQDHDGSHIKGLLINFLQVQYPSLLKIPDFFQEFTTPIVKVWQGSNPKKPLRLKSFFTQFQYEQWKEVHKSELKRWESKYFKGLGTSSNEDAQVYFNDLDNHLKQFDVMKPDEAELFELAFSKKKADARKEWIGGFVPGTYLDPSIKLVSYDDFVNKELILYSIADNMRSIPSVIDGLKPGQRKVIYACLKRNLVKDKKVIELAGYVSEQTAYHHGDISLQQTIIGLAQNFVGSNNVNCLEPSGNFGSRLSGGSDAASARYIHTRLSPFARRVFCALDEPNLEHYVEDGKKIEPKVYAPVIPMILVNGADGIGTGWSTSIPNYHPMDIIRNLRRRMGRLDGDDEKPFETMIPWFRGWKGTPQVADNNRYQFNGIAYQNDKNPNEVIVTELPIRVWTDDFKAKLEEIIRGEKVTSFIKDYKEFNDHNNVHFEIQLDEKNMKAALDEGLLEKFKLVKQVATSNMVAFDSRGMVRKYDRVEDIMEEFYVYRMKMYTQRRSHWISVYDTEFRKLSNQARFVREIMDGKLVVSRKKKQVIIDELREKKYEAFSKGPEKKTKSEEEEEGGVGEGAEEADTDSDARGYDYLLSMAIWSFTQERLDRLHDQIAKKKSERDELQALSEKDLWCRDLDEFEAEWENQQRLEAEIATGIHRMGRRTSKKIGAGRPRKNKGDDDWEPGAKSRPGAKAAPKPKAAPKEKSAQRFTAMFNGDAKKKATTTTTTTTATLAAPAPEKVSEIKVDSDSDPFSDDDFAKLKNPGKKESKPAAKDPAAEAPPPPGARAKRAAATKAKTWIVDDSSEEEDDDDDDDMMLGDVGDMVKGIKSGGGDGGGTSGAGTGRLSLFSMSSGGSGGGANSAAAALKVKTSKPAKTFDFGSDDDTNYELLAKSPQKKTRGDELDSFLSADDDDLPPVSKVVSRPKPSASADPKPAKSAASAGPVIKKARGRPAGSKSKDEEAPAKKAAPAKAKPSKASTTTTTATHLSPAAKAYAAKKGKEKTKAKRDDFDMDDSEEEEEYGGGGSKGKKGSTRVDDEDEDEDELDSPPPRPAARSSRPGRAAATKSRPVYVIDDDDDEDEEDSFVVNDKKADLSDFDMDDSE
ncbi:type II DNA topoisomerase [Durotheca rogersii]|uniref:type II DNA topoisomerase n=1 Tax=Durotheca rogersii TaxID=419775 RepID=UPI00221EBF40|nr:type II DNA topoisomerase [Durotheca rogersii]KAI5866663.1 type II DNA topoisomerase [Durotheca rogersii]